MLACFKVRPPECIDSRKAQLLGGYFNDGRTMHALHVDLLPIESFGALISAAIWTWILCRNLVGLLAGWVYPFLAWLHPPTLRYTHAVSLSSREREILLHYSRSLNPSSGIQTLGTGIQLSASDWESFYESTCSDETRNSNKKFFGIVKCACTDILQFPAEFGLVIMMLFAASLAASCAACFAVAS